MLLDVLILALAHSNNSISVPLCLEAAVMFLLSVPLSPPPLSSVLSAEHVFGAAVCMLCGWIAYGGEKGCWKGSSCVCVCVCTCVCTRVCMNVFVLPMCVDLSAANIWICVSACMHTQTNGSVCVWIPTCLPVNCIRVIFPRG